MGLVSEISKIQSLGNNFSIVFYYFLLFTIEIIHVFYIKIPQSFLRNSLQIVKGITVVMKFENFVLFMTLLYIFTNFYYLQFK